MVHIDVLVTAGGRGSRMRDVPGEKPLVPVLGKPMIDRVLDALAKARGTGQLVVSVSENTPLTTDHLRSRGIEIVGTSGSDYVADLRQALKHLRSSEVLVCPADLPLITSVGVEAVLSHFRRAGVSSLSVAVPADLVRSLGAFPSYVLEENGREIVVCGASVVDREQMLSGATLSQGFAVIEDEQFALNVNTREELRRAEELLRRRERANTSDGPHGAGKAPRRMNGAPLL